eukprot:CAMPEP_0197065300 /NCGR_PEP_ID=MMETSP1384-20130603/165831_1 /TAXON_ID=29189 /ORGANISM="Ammonia sp." /LENGTH=65 /DNA_ID=CAMNT_0042502069 /DNA_START=34 /DNA_END=231 /DNA_ORIENTATION=-
MTTISTNMVIPNEVAENFMGFPGSIKRSGARMPDTQPITVLPNASTLNTTTSQTGMRNAERLNTK